MLLLLLLFTVHPVMADINQSLINLYLSNKTI